LGSGSLETIIVDTVATATACIHHIKSNNIGRGNFFALEKAEKWQQNLRQDFRAPENAPRIVDLIKLPEESEKFRLAFYHYFR
jgi:structural maintenance of chromosome 4